jgi:hypothetical protein
VRNIQAKISDAEFNFKRLENENLQAKEKLATLVSLFHNVLVYCSWDVDFFFSRHSPVCPVN